MTELDVLIRDTLAEHDADGEATRDLLSGALRRSRQLQRRRAATATAVVVAAVGATSTVAVAMAASHGSHGPAQVLTSTPPSPSVIASRTPTPWIPGYFRGFNFHAPGWPAACPGDNQANALSQISDTPLATGVDASGTPGYTELANVNFGFLNSHYWRTHRGNTPGAILGGQGLDKGQLVDWQVGPIPQVPDPMPTTAGIAVVPTDSTHWAAYSATVGQCVSVSARSDQ